MIFFRYPMTLFMALLLSGCAATTKDLPSRLLYPGPPDEPRFEFIGAYGSADDMATSKADLLRKSFLGSVGNDRFIFPTGVAVNSEGIVYVSDAMDKNIKVIDFQKKTIHYMFKASPVTRPNGLAFDREGRLYVADSLVGMVQVFAPGTEVSERKITYPEMERPAYVAINDRLGRVYVTDSKVHRVFVFAKDGQFLFKFGQGSTDPAIPDGLYGPQGVAIAPDDTVFISEILQSRVSVFDADGNYLRAFGERGDSFWAFDHPKALAFDNEGHLYVVDARLGKIVVYTVDGKLLMFLGGSRTFEASGFVYPVAIAFDAHNRFFVADAMAKRVSVWQYMDEDYKKKNPVTPAEIKEIEDYQKRAQKVSPPQTVAPAKP